MEVKPILYLTGQAEGPPTLADLIALSRALLGRDPTPEETARAAAILATPGQS